MSIYTDAEKLYDQICELHAVIDGMVPARSKDAMALRALKYKVTDCMNDMYKLTIALSGACVAPVKEPTIIHTAACLKAQEAYNAYVAANPNFCRHCYATGKIYAPPTMEEPEYNEDCEKCLGEGKCPVCGKESISAMELGKIFNGHIGWYTNYHCKACGWDSDSNVPGCPDVDCNCGEAC